MITQSKLVSSLGIQSWKKNDFFRFCKMEERGASEDKSLSVSKTMRKMTRQIRIEILETAFKATAKDCANS